MVQLPHDQGRRRLHRSHFLNRSSPAGGLNPAERKDRMNIEAIASAEQFAKNVLMFPTEKQDEFFKMLPSLGLTEEEVKNLQEYVTLYHMFTDPYFYNKVKTTVAMMLYETFNSK